MLRTEAGFAERIENTTPLRQRAVAVAPAQSRARPAAWSELVPLAAIPGAAWSALAANAVEPNAFYQPVWATAVAQHARDQGAVRALATWSTDTKERLIGLLPVIPAWSALTLPVPMLVAWQAYAPLVTPLIDRDLAETAWTGLLDAARASGARALFLPAIGTDGAAFRSLDTVLTKRNLTAHAIAQFGRAGLDATGDAELLLREALGPKKLKELRRQRNRLADSGPVTFDVARDPVAIASALENFLALEMRGWKARRGTALAQHDGDAAFIRDAVPALAARGGCEIVTLAHGGVPVAAGIVLRQGARVFFFKIAIDESEAKASPGVQLTLDLTRHLCADPDIRDADSTADADHPMIDHVWRGRLAIADLFVPLCNGPSTVLIRKLVTLRAAARLGARRLVRAIRAIRGKTP
jgi:CelD/BcsL family acetyltransferase involved in cellulose biosynthesis